jgi:hypothetical protein
MTQTQIKDAAKKYVSEQLDVLKKHGSISKAVSKNEYNNIVKQVVRASSK